MSSFIGDLDLRVIGERLWETLHQFSYQSSIAATVINVPAGFQTDLLSTWGIPGVAEVFDGTNAKPAVIHDYLYTSKILDREISDKVLREACILNGCNELEADAIYQGVRLFGGTHWD